MDICDDPDFSAGRSLFNDGHFWHAHEAWETLWLRSAGDQRQCVQGLIQAAAALVHWERGNRRGLELNWAKARARLAPLPSPFQGLDLAALISWMDGMAARELSAAPRLG